LQQHLSSLKAKRLASYPLYTEGRLIKKMALFSPPQTVPIRYKIFSLTLIRTYDKQRYLRTTKNPGTSSAF
jgi:hypothetical protein